MFKKILFTAVLAASLIGCQQSGTPTTDQTAQPANSTTEHNDDDNNTCRSITTASRTINFTFFTS
jgi:hypothetical protein